MPLLLCDLDNTILDRASTFRDWATEFAARHDQGDAFVRWMIEVDGHGYGSGYGASRHELFTAVRDRLDLPDPVDTLVADYLREYLPRFRCEDSVNDSLVTARARGWRIAIVTNGPATQADKIRNAGVDRLVDALVISALEGYSKPDPRLLEIAADRLGEPLSDAWMIGDSPVADIAAANNAGIESVWLRHGRTWPEDDFTPTHVADSFAEAINLVLGLR